MLLFLLKRIGTMLLTALCLSFVVFFLTNQPAMLEKVAKFEGNARMSDEEVARFLDKNGFGQPMLVRYGEWLGVLPGWTHDNGDSIRGRCIAPGQKAATAPRHCGVLQGDWGSSRVFRDKVGTIIGTRLALTGKMMLWVMILMVPTALVIGVLAGMREGSRLDRGLSTLSIATTATPE
ncbi:MAG: ABC transporter permease, partial [Pseudomonadota bacterium]|nr:ABC transporter permease [Pseudomonadota bacterium]